MATYRAVRLYLSSMAGGYTLVFWLGVLVFLGLCEMLGIVETWWLGYWAQQYEDIDPTDVNVA